MRSEKPCPDCDSTPVDRRDFLKTAAGAAALAGAAVVGAPMSVVRAAPPTASSAAEQALTALYGTLTDMQKRTVCFDWDHTEMGDNNRGLLRTHVSNNWQITRPHVDSDFYTADQKRILFDIFKGIIHPDWHTRIQRQLRDDTEGRPWGAAQSVAIFGRPGSDKFEFVMTGRHMTIRCDGNTTPNVAFGGPIFYGHAASGFNETTGHPGNIFWNQAQRANFVYRMLDERQKRAALVEHRPAEAAVAFRGERGGFPGLPVSDMSSDQKDELRRVLGCLVEPYRQEDRDDAMACLQRQGGLDRCSLAFYRDGDIGNDGEWDNWRLEGPSFVWYYRGHPHVHVWVNIADDPSVALNAKG
jgi:Protein of unknown function (DUF3500)/TAT (twin-arginine translocation) pathway signal sequence